MSSVVPVRPGVLSGAEPRRILRTLGRQAWPLVRETATRFRYGDGFSHSRALGLQLALAVVPVVIAVVGLSDALGTGSVGRWSARPCSRCRPARKTSCCGLP